jgi:response regulator of citrate/malate metabolism
MGEKIKNEQLLFLQRIKPMLSSSQTSLAEETVQDTITTTRPSDRNQTNVDELIQRVEKIEKFLEIQDNEGVRKGKIKEQIISLLQQNKKLTSSQLSNLLGLSRTRCNEYFRELTKEGQTEGLLINRQKYYKLVGK